MSDLEQYRQEIDELDEQLVRLFLRRMEVTGKVGEYKLAHGMQVLDRERERRVLAKRASLAVDIRQEEDVKELFQTIMAISRRRQQELIDRSGTGTVRKTNVVLIGMPGAGKTSCGKRLARMLGRPFVDIDEAILADTGRSAAQIIQEDGEEDFRRVETEVTASYCKRSGMVIACGGGVVTRPQNRDLLRQNGRVVLVDRPLDELSDKGRPVSQAKGVERLAAERMHLYHEWADVILRCTGSAQSDAELVKELLRL